MKTATSILFFLLSFCLSAEIEVHKLSEYPFSGGHLHSFVPMDYGSATVEPDLDLGIDAYRVTAIHVLSSDYPKGADMTALNKKRLEAVYRLVPGLKDRAELPVAVMLQDKCASMAEAKELAHGVILYLNPSAYGGIREMVKSKEKASKVGGCRLKSVSSLDPSKPYDLHKKIMIKNGDTIVSAIDTTFYYITRLEMDCSPARDKEYESLIFRVMERNPEWKNMMVCADLTGSMSPYTAQILLWFKLHMDEEKIRQFVFFNDGDNKPTVEKEIGKVGGVYIGQHNEFDSLLVMAETTMRNGGGGEGMESVLEPVYKGKKACTDCDELVLIADNWAPVRDMRMCIDIRKPVKVIACGVNGAALNIDLLNIALRTGGSFHTMEDDLTDLVKMKEGETIEIGGYEYVIRSGKFERLVKA